MNFELTKSSSWMIQPSQTTTDGPKSIKLRARFANSTLVDDLASIIIECIKVQFSPMSPFIYEI